jgi:hypothetical protein
VLKNWAKGLSKLKEQLKQCDAILLIIDKLEEKENFTPQKETSDKSSRNSFSSSCTTRKYIGSKDTQ